MQRRRENHNEQEKISFCRNHELLRRIQKERQLTYLIISHDLALVSHLCTRVLVMYQGKIVEEGDVKKVLRNPEHPYTKLLLASGATFIPDPYFYNRSK